MSFYKLKIIKIVSETADTKSFYFEIPQELKPVFSHAAGQFLTLKADIGSKEVRRSYSLCTAPDESLPAVTVKKVSKGTMSVYLTTKINEGDHIDVMPPEGHFTLQADHMKSRFHFFIVAGSGITPAMSMLKTVLEHEPKSVCHLLYGNRDENSIIFKNELDLMTERYRDQLYVHYVLSQPSSKKTGGIGGLFAKKVVDWQGMKGRINADHIRKFLGESDPGNKECHYYICGPGDMIEKTEHTLISFGIDKKHIHKEYFTAPHYDKNAEGQLQSAKVKVTLKGEEIDIEVPKGKTILDVLVDMKKDPPYSCTSGACSTCMAKVTSGQVSMDACYALEDDEVAAGYILTCQSHPKSDVVAITYDV